MLLATFASLLLVIEGWLEVPIDGSIALFLTGLALSLFATTGLGIFFATLARSMPQFGLLMILCMVPLQMLSGGMTPRESMPVAVQKIMLLAPTTHFVELGQAILYRGAGIESVWKPFLALAAIGAALFALSFMRFRKMLSSLA
ncbi:Inner membrane transport permease YhhJ [bioreactor metagenome]|uniref:Inner membrane transport permease YhhJ n=1 Tax=bioreactor metagenome TaxID=1076179 RepID=A0A645FHW7_9ZZZZ